MEIRGNPGGYFAEGIRHHIRRSINLDTIRAINHEIFDYLKADTTLTDLMGNSNIREGLAFRSDTYPYIRYDINPK